MVAAELGVHLSPGGVAETARPLLLAGALGECVHVAGVHAVMKLAAQHGWETVFLGPAVPVNTFVAAIAQNRPTLVALSYRLTPQTGEALLRSFRELVVAQGLGDYRFCFGGTPPVVQRARGLGWIEACFDGTEPPEQLADYLRGAVSEARPTRYADTFQTRVAATYPRPLLRHHFGRPTVAATIDGVAEIAAAGALDVISLGTDQDAQENFFHPQQQDLSRAGAGGVPVRSAQDFTQIYQASRCGNFPLVRTYAGTRDLIRLAQLHRDTISNAWCAVPLFWFNAMDGRGPMPLQESIRARQEAMAWHGARGIAVELNEPHHWGMRDAPDVVFCAASFLAAYNARSYGVTDYIAQFMFNSPAGTSDAMDLAKMLACLDLIEPLSQDDQRPFRIYRQTRTGLLSYPTDLAQARGQLAASVYLQMALHPHVVHVVGFSEADHEATSADIIEGCGIARRAIDNALRGQPDPTYDPAVRARREQLVTETTYLLDQIAALAPADVDDPWADAETLTRAVELGLMDAPQLRSNRFGRGRIVTSIVGGSCVAVNPVSGQPISEAERLSSLAGDAVAVAAL